MSTITAMVWTRFADMHSGGAMKLPWKYIYIEAPQDEARLLFMEAFGRDADHVTCDHCGSDYSVMEEPTLDEATEGDRGDRSVGDFIADPYAWDLGRRREVKLLFRPDSAST